MSGLFPEGIQFLTSLTKLQMGEGGLRGPLPTVLSQMKRLVFLELHANKFTGSIASEWYQDWTHLQHLDLSNNKLSGTIAPEIGNWKELQMFFVESNLFSGSIPSEIGGLANALRIVFSDNLISGTIPGTIRNLDSLERLNGVKNLLTGTIPQEISKADNLVEILLSDNLLSGTLDALYVAQSKLRELHLDGNRLTGTISPDIALLTNLYILTLRDNEFSGQLPTELGLLQLNRYVRQLLPRLEKQHSCCHLLLLLLTEGCIMWGARQTHILYFFSTPFPHLPEACRLPATILRDLSRSNCAPCDSKRTTGRMLGVWKRTVVVHWTVPRVVVLLAACREESTAYRRTAHCPSSRNRQR